MLAEKFKELVDRFLLYTTLHGLQYGYQPTHVVAACLETCINVLESSCRGKAGYSLKEVCNHVHLKLCGVGDANSLCESTLEDEIKLISSSLLRSKETISRYLADDSQLHDLITVLAQKDRAEFEKRVRDMFGDNPAKLEEVLKKLDLIYQPEDK